MKALAKQHQYRKYKEVYKIDIDILKKLINGCAELHAKTVMKHKAKGLDQKGGNDITKNLFAVIY